MMIETNIESPVSRWRWTAAIWCAGALFDACQTVIFMQAIGKPHAWLIFGTELVSWLPWMLATPSVIGLAQRFNILRSRAIRTGAVHLAAFASISLVAEACDKFTAGSQRASPLCDKMAWSWTKTTSAPTKPSC